MAGFVPFTERLSELNTCQRNIEALDRPEVLWQLQLARHRVLRELERGQPGPSGVKVKAEFGEEGWEEEAAGKVTELVDSGRLTEGVVIDALISSQTLSYCSASRRLLSMARASPCPTWASTKSTRP